MKNKNIKIEYGLRTENKRTHGKGQHALRNTVYGLLDTRTWKASLAHE